MNLEAVSDATFCVLMQSGVKSVCGSMLGATARRGGSLEKDKHAPDCQ